MEKTQSFSQEQKRFLKPPASLYEELEAKRCEIRGSLSGCKDIITPEQKSAIIKRKTDKIRKRALKLIDEWKIKRIAGEENDNQSLNPGITIFVTEHGKKRILGFHSDSNFEEVVPGVWKVSFPDARYLDRDGNTIFLDQLLILFDNKQKINFTIYDKNIIRIEGKDGSLWQNGNYDWEFNPKNRQQIE